MVYSSVSLWLLFPLEPTHESAMAAMLLPAIPVLTQEVQGRRSRTVTT